MTGVGSLSMSLRKAERQWAILSSATWLIRTVSFFQTTARTVSRLMSALFARVTVMGGLDPPRKAFDALRSLGDLIFIHCQSNAQMTCTAGAEALPRHGDDSLLGEEPSGELVAREAGLAH